MSPNNMYRYLSVLLLDPSQLVLFDNKMAFSGVVVFFFFVITSVSFFFVAFQRRWRTSKRCNSDTTEYRAVVKGSP